MTDEQVKFSIQRNEVCLRFWQTITHYAVVFFLLFIPSALLFFHLMDYLEGKPSSLKEGEVWFLITPSVLAIIFYLIQKNRLQFKVVKTDLPKSQLKSIVHELANEAEWIANNVHNNAIIATTHPSFFSGSWGEQITIIFDKGRVLINSICDPQKRSSVVSMGRNKKNTDMIIQKIQEKSR